MDDTRMTTLATELKTLYDQLLRSPPDEPDLMLPHMVRYVSLTNELIMLRLTDLDTRLTRLEAAINRPASP